MNARADMTPPDARHEAARMAMVRALEGAVAAAERLPDGQAALGECLAICLDHVAAGEPPVTAFANIRDDASWWADCATPQELEVYASAILRRISRATFAENARKRLLVSLWDSLTPEQQAAFLRRAMPSLPTERTEGDVFAAICAAVNPRDYDLTRAEGRKDFDNAIRFMIGRLCGTDEALKRHVADMVSSWRRDLFKHGGQKATPRA